MQRIVDGIVGTAALQLNNIARRDRRCILLTVMLLALGAVTTTVGRDGILAVVVKSVTTTCPWKPADAM